MNQNMKLGFRKKDIKRNSTFKKQLYFSLSPWQLQWSAMETVIDTSQNLQSCGAPKVVRDWVL